MTPDEARKILMNLVDQCDFDFAAMSPDEVIAEFAEAAGLSTDEARELIKGLAANVKSNLTPAQARRYIAGVLELSRVVATQTGTVRMPFERAHELIQAQLLATADSNPFRRESDMMGGLLAEALKSQPLTVCRH